MNLIAEAAGFGQGTFTLRCQQLENRRIVFQQDPWQSVGLLANEQSYGAGHPADPFCRACERHDDAWRSSGR